MFSVGFLRASAILVISLSACSVPAADGAIPFDVGGLDNTGVAGQIKFSFDGATGSNRALSVSIGNVSSVRGRNGGFTFKVRSETSDVLHSKNAMSVTAGAMNSGARIADLRTNDALSKLRFNGTGSGLRTLSDSKLEQAFMNELSVDAGYSFGVRYQAIGTNGLSDFAVPATTTNAVPVPGAAVLAAIGLGIVGLIHRKKSPR